MGYGKKVRRSGEALARILAVLERTGTWMSSAEVAAGSGSTWDSTQSVAGHLRLLYVAGRVERRVLRPGTEGRGNTHEYRALDRARRLEEENE